MYNSFVGGGNTKSSECECECELCTFVRTL